MTKRPGTRIPLLTTRREALLAGVAAGAAILLPRTAYASYEFACDLQSGFVMDPNSKKRFGYLTDFNGLGLSTALTSDLTVSCAFPTAPSYSRVQIVNKQAKVVGVLQNVSWNGGVGDPFSITAYVSQENATRLKAMQQLALKTTAIKSLGFWVADYDAVAKAWYEQHYPVTPAVLTGTVIGTAQSPNLNVDLSPVRAATGIDVMVYKVSFAVGPAANQNASFQVASSASQKAVKNWGLVVGR